MEKINRKEKLIYWVAIPLIAAIIPVLFGWKTLANLNDWVPIGECPGTPFVISISSPEDGVTLPIKIDYDGTDRVLILDTTFVLDFSRPISNAYEIALLTRVWGDTKYYFNPLFYFKIRVTPNKINIPAPIITIDSKHPDNVEIRAVVVETYESFGKYYSDISQVINNKSFTAISEPILVRLIN